MISISIVIPAYNVEKTIVRAVDSVLNQTYSNIELIIVDDGSSDDTPKICDSYKEKDERVKVIHQNNSGVCEARNVGIDISKGEYIYFLDADDWLDLDYFKNVIQYLETKKYSLVCNSYIFIQRNKTKYIKCFSPETELLNKEEALLELFLYRMICWGPFACFYRNDVIKQIKFNKNIRYGEDLLFKYQSIIKTNGQILYAPISGYFYDNSIENSATNSYSISKKIDDLKVLRYIMRSEPIFYRLIYSKWYIPRVIFYSLQDENSLNLEDREICFSLKEKLKKSFFEILSNSDISIKTKIQLLLLFTPKNAKNFILKFYNYLKSFTKP